MAGATDVSIFSSKCQRAGGQLHNMSALDQYIFLVEVMQDSNEMLSKV